MKIEVLEQDDADNLNLNYKDDLYFYPNKSKIVVIDGEPLGFYTTNIILGNLTLEYNLFEKQRNKKLGYAFVNIVTELAGRDNPDYSMIYLLILRDNKKSIRVAEQNKYSLDLYDEFCDMIREEMPDYSVYCKKNEFYKKKVGKKTL